MKNPALKTQLKDLRFKVRHRLFVFERTWHCHPFFHWFYPRAPFARRLIASLLTFLILVPTMLLIFRPTTADAVWFDDNYAYRQKFSFTDNTGASSPRRISFTLNTQNLVSNGVMQADCDDTRFTDINGNLLRFKLTGSCNVGSTTYDVVFPSILTGTNANVGYVYYGNPRAVSVSQDVSDVTALTPSGGAPSVTTRTNEEQAPSPALFLMLDEGYGSTTQDASQNRNTGGVRGASWKTSEYCVVGNCLQFDGLDDTVIATNAASIDFDTGLATASAFQAWVRLNSTGENSVGQIFNKGTNTYLRVTNASGGKADLEAKFDLASGTDPTVTVTQGIELNRWTHVAMTYTDDADDEITVYINGVNRGTSTTGSDSPAADTNDLIIGGPNQAHVKGFIDEFKIYPYERTQAQIATEVGDISSLHGKSATIGSDDSYLSDGLIAYWKMDDGVNNACAAGVDKACDSSGNGKTATWTNGVASTSGKFGFATTYDGVNALFDPPSTTVGTTHTISLWVYPIPSSDSYAALTVQSDSNSGVFYRGSTRKIDYFYNSTDHHNNTALTENTWSHILISVTDGTATFYVNGVADGTATGVPSYNIDQIGNDGNSEGYKGRLDDLRIYNRAFSPTEVSRLYDWGPSPVGWWKLDEGTGTSAFDSSGNGTIGTFRGTVSSANGKFGKALEFAGGIYDQVDLGDPAILKTTLVTASAWVKMLRTQSATQGIISHDAGINATDPGYRILIPGNTTQPGVQLYNGTTHTLNTTTSMALGVWNHIAFTYDGTKIKFFINGVQDPTTITTSGDITYNTTHFNIGRGDDYDDPCDANCFPFAGFIDDVRIYSYARTQKQILADMNANHPSVGSPVGSAIGHWKFDDGFDKTASNSGIVGAGLNGKLLGAIPPTWRNEGKFGKALNFSGASAYVKVGNDTAAQITSDLTLSSWVYLSSTSNEQTIIAKRGPPGQWAYRLFVDTGTPKIDIVSPANAMATASAAQTLATNQWYQLVGTYSSSQSALTIYVNGLQQGQTTSAVPASIKNSTADLNIGAERFGTVNRLNGSLDEVKLYNYSLSADEVKVEYNQGKAVVWGSLSTEADGYTATNSAAAAYCVPGDTATCNPPVGHWTFDERTGTTANDISGNENTGTLFNGTSWATGKLGQGVMGNRNFVNQRVEVNNSSSINLNSTLTIAFWIKSNAEVDFGNMITKSNFSTAGWAIQNKSGGNRKNITMRVDTSAASNQEACGSGGVTNGLDGTWHHIVYILDNGACRAYKDGILVNSGTYSVGTGFADPSDQLYLATGVAQDSVYDDIRLYNYARTPRPNRLGLQPRRPRRLVEIRRMSRHNRLRRLRPRPERHHHPGR